MVSFETPSKAKLQFLISNGGVTFLPPASCHMTFHLSGLSKARLEAAYQRDSWIWVKKDDAVEPTQLGAHHREALENLL